ITIGFLNTPQGVAYAILGMAPAVTGLYVSFFPLLVYIVMATSRQCSLGTDSITSMMTSKIVHQFALKPTGNSANDSALLPGLPYTAVEWSQVQVGTAVALMVGLWQLAFGLLGAGGLVVYFSDQLVQGFTCGAAVHVFSSQLKSVFGVKGMLDHFGVLKVIRTWINFFQVIKTTHIPTMITAFIAIIFLVVVKFGLNTSRRVIRVIRVPLPAELFVVIFGTLISAQVGLEANYGVSIIKRIPNGFPTPSTPTFAHMYNTTNPEDGFPTSLLSDTFAIAVVSLCLSITLALLFANQHGYAIDPNQEFKAQGLSKIFGSFFHCFPSSVSVARTAVQNDVGGRTQMVSVVQCAIVAVVIGALGQYMEPLPRACLGAIVMVSVLKLLFQIVQLVRLWHLSLVDWSIFVAVFLGVVILDVDIGLAVGVGWAIATVMLRLQKPKVGPLGRLPGTDIYRRTDVYLTAGEIPGVKIVRVDSPIYFANASYVKSRLYAWADLNNLITRWKETHKVDPTDNDSLKKEDFAYANNIAMDDDDEDEYPEGIVASLEPSVAQRRQSLLSSLSASLGTTRRNSVQAINLEDFSSQPRSYMSQGGLLKAEEEEEIPIKHLIIDCSEICFVDVTGVGFLKKTQSECAAIEVELLLACTNKPVRDMLALCGAVDYIQPHQYFVTLHDAVLYALKVQKQPNRYTASHKVNGLE
ncbi:Solute carrier family 26 member 6, partial [Hypsibius exemplaris]